MLGKIDITAWQLRMAQRPVSRRDFLQVSGLAGVGFLVGCAREPESAAKEAAAVTAPEAAPADTTLNAFVRIANDNTVTVIVKHLDKGQGVTTGLPTIVAEELDADWEQMRHEFAPADAGLYNNFAFGPVQGTGGSSSVANSWQQLRHAAAGARAMLVGAAAAAWGVSADEITVSKGVVSHQAGDHRATFGELALAAADIVPPAEPKLKTPEEFTLIGTHVPRLDSAAKTDGSAKFTSDVDLPGMVHAAIAHPPKFGAQVRSFDATRARAISGVLEIVQVPRGVAVIADSFWTAMRGRDVLDIQWDKSQAELRGDAQMRADYREKMKGAGLAARNDGDATGTFAAAVTKLDADYDLPFLAHATMEPMNCVVQLGEASCEIWSGSQIQTIDQGVAAHIAGLQPDQVKIHTHFAGGSFGRRAVPDSDYLAEAVSIARAAGLKVPLKLQWTRENDMRGGRYRPLSCHRIRAGLDAKGNLVAWHHQEAIQSFMLGTPFEGLIQDGIDSTSVEGAHNLPYAIPNYQVDLYTVPNKVPTLWWRSVGHTQNAFVTETFFDEVAVAAGRDPVAMRLEMIGAHPRMAAVLQLAAERSDWGSPLAAGRGRGVALHESFNTKVAEVAEVTVRDDGTFSVDRVVCAVDCGIAVNPDIVKAQVEGAIGFALSAALREAIHLVDGKVDEGNFDRYQPLRINEMPVIEVHIVPSSESPTGIGEPGVPPLAPAVANALFAATGKRYRRLPLQGAGHRLIGLFMPKWSRVATVTGDSA